MADDLQLWDRVKADDPEAFGDLYERHARAVQSYCLWRTADLQGAEDATATVFLETWRERKRLTLSTDSAAPLLLGIANNAVQRLRQGGEAIRRLPRREREVLALLAWSDLSYGEIAAALSLPIGTVRSRIARARTRLGDAFPDLTDTSPAEEVL
jgi:DNA-directed RNA polymerase specialized sigma24 family protein